MSFWTDLPSQSFYSVFIPFSSFLRRLHVFQHRAILEPQHESLASKVHCLGLRCVNSHHPPRAAFVIVFGRSACRLPPPHTSCHVVLLLLKTWSAHLPLQVFHHVILSDASGICYSLHLTKFCRMSSRAERLLLQVSSAFQAYLNQLLRSHTSSIFLLF